MIDMRQALIKEKGQCDHATDIRVFGEDFMAIIRLSSSLVQRKPNDEGNEYLHRTSGEDGENPYFSFQVYLQFPNSRYRKQKYEKIGNHVEQCRG